MSTSYQGLQHHLDCFTSWCARNFVTINATKSQCTIFGTLPSPLPLPTLARLRLPRPVTLSSTDLSPAYVCTVREALQLSMFDSLVGVETNRKLEFL
ncbi:hypothetical protein M422DRAFT_39955, partial [Sphaerobolus stellatus SS14]